MGFLKCFLLRERKSFIMFALSTYGDEVNLKSLSDINPLKSQINSDILFKTFNNRLKFCFYLMQPRNSRIHKAAQNTNRVLINFYLFVFSV